MNRSAALALSLTLAAAVGAARAQEVDIVAIFAKADQDKRVGIAKKTKPVDARLAKPGEVIVTVILGEGVETKSPPAQDGDMEVRNRCPETGNEVYLVAKARFPSRYSEPNSPVSAEGWREYRPIASDMRYFILKDGEGPFSFKALWGEAMVAKPGDAIVQNPTDPKDTYRIARASFGCTYEIVKAP